MACIPVEQVRPIGIVWEYSALIDALDRQRRRRGMTMLALDERAGFYEGYSGHVFSWELKTGRMLGALSFPLILEALGLALAVVEIDPAQKPKTAATDDQLDLPLPIPEHRRYGASELKARRPEVARAARAAETAKAA